MLSVESDCIVFLVDNRATAKKEALYAALCLVENITGWQIQEFFSTSYFPYLFESEMRDYSGVCICGPLGGFSLSLDGLG